MNLDRVTAAMLRLEDLLVEDGAFHAVKSVRVQGAPAEVLVELEGFAGRRHYPSTAVLTVHRRAA